MTNCLLLVEYLQLSVDVDRVSHKEKDWRRWSGLFESLFDELLDAVLCRLANRGCVGLGVVFRAVHATTCETRCVLVAAEGQGAIWIDELCEHVQLKAHIVEVVDCANDLVQRLLNKIWSDAAISCKFDLAL